MTLLEVKQLFYDKVVEHLLTQKERAIDESGDCRYRTSNGLKCAVGCLIPDENYSINFEGRKVSFFMLNEILNFEKIEEKLDKWEKHHLLDFLLNLQRIHDRMHLNQWYYIFKAFAQGENLNTDVLKKFKREELKNG